MSVKVNPWTVAVADKGDRRYCSKDSHSSNIHKWVSALKARLEGGEPEVPLTRAICEVGYAIFPCKRLKEHKKRINSNYIMNLVEAV